jgi:hypothetical protein
MDPKEQTGEGVHLFSRSGFLDGDWWHRSFWIYGKGVNSGYGGWYRPANFAPAGRLMVFDDERVYGFDRKPEFMCNASIYEYFLYGADKQTQPDRIERVSAAMAKLNAASSKRSASSSDWAARRKFSVSELTAAGYKWAEGDMPLQARGMVLAGGTIFIAGPPDLVNEEQVFRNQDDPAIKAKLAEQAAAFEVNTAPCYGRSRPLTVASSLRGNSIRCPSSTAWPPPVAGCSSRAWTARLSASPVKAPN